MMNIGLPSTDLLFWKSNEKVVGKGQFEVTIRRISAVRSLNILSLIMLILCNVIYLKMQV